MSRFWKVALCICLALVLAACGQSNEKKYEAAEALVAEGKYDEAITAFEGLKGFGDSGKYITYIKCLQLGDSGQYDTAVSSLRTLGEFKEAAFFAIYYTARGHEHNQDYETAAAEYRTIATFQDAAERLEKMPDMILDRDFSSAQGLLDDGWTDSASYAFQRLADQQYAGEPDRMLTRVYDLAKEQLTAGKFEAAYGLFDILADRAYSDAASMMQETEYQYALQALEDGNRETALSMLYWLGDEGYEQAKTKLMEIAYLEAQQLLEAGQYEVAASAFDELGVYSDAADKAKEARYQYALSLKDSGAAYAQRAYELFSQLTDYKDSSSQAKAYEEAYSAAKALLDNRDYDGAEAAFQALGSYADSADMQMKSRYQKAMSLLEDGQFAEAYALFVRLGAYADAVDMQSETQYRMAAALLAEGRYDDAANAYLALSGYKEAAAMVQEAKYQKAAAMAEQGDIDSAVAILNSISGYKDSASVASRLKAERCFDQGQYADAWVIFASLEPAYQTRNAAYDKLYAAAEERCRQGEYESAIAQFEALGGYADAAEQATAARYLQASGHAAAGEYDQAIDLYRALNDEAMVNHTIYSKAEALLQAGQYAEASAAWLGIAAYQDSRDRSCGIADKLYEKKDYAAALPIYVADIDYLDIKNRVYTLAGDAAAALDYDTAVQAYTRLDAYKDSAAKLNMTRYAYAEHRLQLGEFDAAAALFAALGDFSDAKDRIADTHYAAAGAAFEAADYADAATRFKALGAYRDAPERANQALYAQADALEQQGDDMAAYETFSALGQYLDSSERAVASHYQGAIQLMNDGEYADAADAFLALGKHENSRELLTQCRYHLAQSHLDGGDPLRAAELLPAIRGYQDSEKLLQKSYIMLGDRHAAKAQHERAYACYAAAGDDPDASMRAAEAAYACAEKHLDAADYGKASTWYARAGAQGDAQQKLLDIVAYYMTAQQYDLAENALSLMADQAAAAPHFYDIGAAYERQGDMDSAARLYQKAGSHSNALAKYHTIMYNNASELMGRGAIQEACARFNAIREYSDAAALADALALQVAYQPGDEVTWGAYQQDGDAGGTKEPIEWIVLEVQNNRALLLSKYGLDAVAFAGDGNRTPTWETSLVRRWLNNEFLQQAFTAEEQTMLLSVDLANQGDADRVFLLSSAEARRFRGELLTLECSPTLNAVLNGGDVRKDRRCAWMLRNVYHSNSKPYAVDANGSISASSALASRAVIRPAVWVDLSNAQAARLADNAVMLDGQAKETSITPSPNHLRDMEIASNRAEHITSITRYESKDQYSHGVALDASLEDCYFTFRLPDQCKTLTATMIGIGSCAEEIYTRGDKKYQIQFYADDTLIQSFANLTENMKVQLKLNVDGARTLTIKATNEGDYSNGLFALTNIALTIGNLPTVNEQNPYLPDVSSVAMDSAAAIGQYLQSAHADYLTAQGLVQAAQYEEAYALLKAMPGLADSGQLIKACEYHMALSKLAAGAYDEAYALLSRLRGYADVNSILLTNERLISIASSRANPCIISSGDAVVGQYVTFGHYEQDNDLLNGREPIEWLVLEADEASALLISRYVLDGHSYSDDGARTTWNQSALRAWLNETFLQTAFDERESRQILLTHVAADLHPEYPKLAVGIDTQDHVFLLSYKQAQAYFPEHDSRKAAGTAYAFARNVSNEDGISYWWLRTPSNLKSRPASDVHCDGRVGGEDNYGYDNAGGVRPVIRINLAVDPLTDLLETAGFIE